MSLDPAAIMAQLYALYELPRYRAKFDFMPPRKDRVRKGFTYEYNMQKGRPPTPNRYEDDVDAMCVDPAGWRVALYPGNYGLACLDFDMPERDSEELLRLCKPLYRTKSRSAYDPSRDTRAGHAWYRAPSKASQLTGFTKLRGVFDGTAKAIDVLYTQLAFIPAQEFGAFLTGLLEWGSRADDVKRQASFPYAFKLINAERPGNRDSVFFTALAQQVWHTDSARIKRDLWHRVLTGIGYFDDNPEAEFNRQFDKVMSQAKGGDTNVHPFTSAGLESILSRLGWDWRYNTRSGRSEFQRADDSKFHSLAHKEPKLEFVDSVRTQFEVSTARVTKPWDPVANWGQVENWLMAYSRRVRRFDPLGEHLKAWQDAPPLDEDTSVLLALMDPAPAGGKEDTLRRCILNVEKNLLLAFYTRIVTSQHDGVPDDVHFPYLPTLVGPRGCGKTRFCKSLAHGFHTSSVRFDDPPKVYAETASVKTVLEFAELQEQMGRAGSQIRGTAKNYIDQTRFDYRAAYDPGSTEHHLAGVLIGTSNKPVAMNANDGLWRRVIHLPVQKRDSLGTNLRHWDRVCDDLLPKALSRAATHHAFGKTPAIKEDLVIDWLHKYFDQYRVSDTGFGWEQIGDEFEDMEELT